MGCAGSKEEKQIGDLSQATAGLSPTQNNRQSEDGETSPTHSLGHGPIKKQYSELQLDPMAPETQDFTGKYIGRVPVTRIQGDAVVRDAHARLGREYTEKVKNINLTISAESIRTVAKKNSVLQDNLIKEVSFCSLNSKDPQSLAYITRDRNNIAMCHFYKIKGGARQVHSAIGTAFKYAVESEKANDPQSETSRYARASSISLTGEVDGDVGLPTGDESAPIAENEEQSISAANEPQKGRDLSEVLGTFEVMYFGSLPCTEMRGQRVVLQKLGVLLNSGKMQPQAVALQITGEGIKAIDLVSSMPVMTSSMIQVCYTTTVQDKGALRGLRNQHKEFSQSVFAYILKDERLSRLTCSLFGCRNLASSNEIAQAVNKAFQVQVEIKKMRQGNPFAAVSSARDTVPMTLFPIQIHRVDIKAKKVIGMGQYGEVYLATQMVKSTGEDGSERTAEVERAVKILRKSASTADRAEFLREAEVMVKLKHDNLVQIIGVAVQQRPWLTVLEYVKYGDLLAVVKTAAEKSFEISYTEQLLWTEQMASGMKYIALKNMIHMDLAARNVLLGERNRVKIADFGLTRELPPGKNYYRLMQTLKLPIKWMALESIKDKIFTVKTDVWGFGIMVWEILSYGEIPYGEVKNIEVEQLVTQGMRLQCVDGCPIQLHDMLAKCWIRNPNQRPNFQQIHNMVIGLIEAAQGSYPPPRDDVGAALHDERVSSPGGGAQTAATGATEQEFVIQDQGAEQWKQKSPAGTSQQASKPQQVLQLGDDDSDEELDI